VEGLFAALYERPLSTEQSMGFESILMSKRSGTGNLSSVFHCGSDSVRWPSTVVAVLGCDTIKLVGKEKDSTIDQHWNDFGG